jgi:hypothetical protein
MKTLATTVLAICASTALIPAVAQISYTTATPGSVDETYSSAQISLFTANSPTTSVAPTNPLFATSLTLQQSAESTASPSGYPSAVASSGYDLSAQLGSNAIVGSESAFAGCAGNCSPATTDAYTEAATVVDFTVNRPTEVTLNLSSSFLNASGDSRGLIDGSSYLGLFSVVGNSAVVVERSSAFWTGVLPAGNYYLEGTAIIQMNGYGGPASQVTDSTSFDLKVVSTPEPDSLALLALGLMGLGSRRRLATKAALGWLATLSRRTMLQGKQSKSNGTTHGTTGGFWDV